MFTHLSTRFILFAIILLAFIGFGAWYILTFSPPQTVMVTDVTDTSAAVLWTTKTPTTSTILLFNDSRLASLIPFTLPFGRQFALSESTVNHRIVVSGLNANTTYYPVIISDGHLYRVQKYVPSNLPSHTIQKSINSPFPILKTLSKALSTISITQINGIVRNVKNVPYKGALVVARYGTGDAIRSVVTDESGRFRIDIPNNGQIVLLITAYYGTNLQTTVPLYGRLKQYPLTITL